MDRKHHETGAQPFCKWALYPAPPRNVDGEPWRENAFKVLEFLLARTAGCTGCPSSASQLCANMRFSPAPATVDQSAASFEMEMSQTGFSAHYSQVWDHLQVESPPYFKKIKESSRLCFKNVNFPEVSSPHQYPAMALQCNFRSVA